MGRTNADTESISTRPYTRWWWFAAPIRHEDIDHQLTWLKVNGFGGVEIAWIYPLRNGRDVPRWLGPVWSVAVAHAKQTADRLGLGCDFTFGSLWPFGDAEVAIEDSHHTFNEPSLRPLSQTWESAYGDDGLVLDHLSEPALRRYAERMAKGLAPALAGSTSSLFCDSWEIPTENLWSPRLWDEFASRFGYRLEEFCRKLGQHPEIRYDYRAFIADVVIGSFYRPFQAICRDLGARSRVQCHGAPTDLLAAYASVDIPESEALLFPVPFSRIAASAAALTGKSVVSAEAFTCMYGFPSEAMGKEQADDIRLLGDGLVANGVNHLIWHGTPYNPPGGDNTFFATVHVGPDSPFIKQLPALNQHFDQISTVMRWGQPVSRLAVYLPLEDNRMRDRLPRELQTPAAQFFWELRYEECPEETEGYAPLWVTRPFLESAQVGGGRLRIGPVSFDGLYVDVEYLEIAAIRAILRLAQEGLPVILRQRPQEPGRNRHADYARHLDELDSLPTVWRNLGDSGLTPLVESDDPPYFWVRGEGDEIRFFFAHPAARSIRYPMHPYQSHKAKPCEREVWISHQGITHELALRFEDRRSILVQIKAGGSVLVRPC